MLPFFRQIKWQIAQFFEIRWWNNYLKGKNPSEYLSWKKGYWQKVLDLTQENSPDDLKNKLQKIDAEQNIIWDAGCGPAGIFILFEKAKVFATDPLLDSYRKEKLLFRSNAQNIKFITAPLEQTHLPEKCDTLFCMNALNHVKNIDQATQQLVSNLQENGLFICSLDCHRFNWLKYIFRLIPGDLLHPHQYNLEDYLELFQKYGLKPISTAQIKKGNIFNHDLLVLSKSE